WNDALREIADPSKVPSGRYGTLTKQVDSGMHALPEDVIVHRGTTWIEFAGPDGMRGYDMPDPYLLKGTVQTQHGYMSTSVGNKSAFSGKPVQMVVRVPAGHKAAWVMPVSNIPNEYELLLSRSTNTFVHDVYQQSNGQWVVEVEVIPEGADLEGWKGMPTS